MTDAMDKVWAMRKLLKLRDNQEFMGEGHRNDDMVNSLILMAMVFDPIDVDEMGFDDYKAMMKVSDKDDYFAERHFYRIKPYVHKWIATGDPRYYMV